jgi:phosphatidylglycerophosphate synthase
VLLERGLGMSLLEGYKASLKPLEVEEPIDFFVHRPLAYGLARMLMPTRVTPNSVTLLALAFGIGCGVCFGVPFPHHLQLGALLLFVGTVLDCTDGQLARLRKTSSEFGRLLDGAADTITLIAAVGGSAFTVVMGHRTPAWHAAVTIGLILLTIHTTHLQLTTYDHYKNLFVRLSCAGRSEGEDVDRAIAKSQVRPMKLWLRVAYFFYVAFLVGQRDFLAWFDPNTTVHLDQLPPYDEERAAIYRKHALAPLRLLKAFMGMGSLVFGLALFGAIDQFDLYMGFRLVLLNAIFFLVFWPMQRRASRAAFREMGLARPAQREPVVA